MDMMLDGPQSQSRRFGKQKNITFLPAIERQSLGHPSCNLVAILTELPQFSSATPFSIAFGDCIVNAVFLNPLAPELFFF